MSDKDEKIEELDERLSKVEERIKPKEVKTRGDPVVKIM